MYSSTARRRVSFLYFFFLFFFFGKNSLLLNSKKGTMETIHFPLKYEKKRKKEFFFVLLLLFPDCLTILPVVTCSSFYKYIYFLFIFLSLPSVDVCHVSCWGSPFRIWLLTVAVSDNWQGLFFRKKPYCTLIGRIFSLTLQEVSNRAFKYSEELFSEWSNLKEPPINTKEFI